MDGMGVSRLTRWNEAGSLECMAGTVNQTLPGKVDGRLAAALPWLFALRCVVCAGAGAAGSLRPWQVNGATNWNNGGMHFSHDYGFGLIDAFAAVKLADSWNLLQILSNC